MSWVWLLVVFVVIAAASIVWNEANPDTVEVCYCSGNVNNSIFMFCQPDNYEDDRLVTSGILQRCEG